MTKTAGVWLDTTTNRLTRSEPERGRILVHPGDEVPEHIAAALGGKEAAKAPSKRETAKAPKAPPKAKKGN